MKKLTHFIFFFFLNAIFLIIISEIFRAYVNPNFHYYSIWFSVLFFTIIGLIINIFPYSKIFEVKTFPGSSYIGYIVSSIVFVVIVFSSKYTVWKELKYNGNVMANHSSIKNLLFGDGEDEFVPMAFHALEAKFDNPNELLLRSFVISKKDKNLDYGSETIYSVYFNYILNDDIRKEFVAKVSVQNNQAYLIFLNQSAAINYTQIYKDEQFGHHNDEEINDMKQSFKNLPDSSQRVIIDTIENILNR